MITRIVWWEDGCITVAYPVVTIGAKRMTFVHEAA